MRRSGLLTTTLIGAMLAAIASDAAAQPSLSPPGAFEPPGAIGPDPGNPAIDVAISDDVLADRAWMSPTALTQPEGSATFSYLQLGPVATAIGTYGVSDRMHMTGIFMTPLGEEGGLYMLSAKYQLINQGTMRLALQGGLTYFDEGTSEQVTIMGAGLAGTMCLDPRCRSQLNGYVGTARVADDDEEPIVATASLVVALSPRIKFVGELDYGFVRDSYGDSATLGWVGGRITSGRFAFDLALVRPLDDDGDDVLPMIGLTYRANP